MQPKPYAIACIVLLALAAFFGYRAYNNGQAVGVKASKSSTTTAKRPTSTTTKKKVTTTTNATGQLALSDLKRGDCVDWDETKAVKDAAIVL